MVTQGLAQGSGRTGAGFAMALRNLLLQHVEHGLHRLNGLCSNLRVDFGFGGCGRSLSLLATGHANLIGPSGDSGQGLGGILCGSLGLRQRFLECVPNGLQLLVAGLQHGCKFRIQRMPVGIVGQIGNVGLPAGEVFGECLSLGLCVLPRLGGQDLNALRGQHRRFALHLHAVLQVFNALHAFGQLCFEGRERFTRERGARFGSIALPGHGIGHVQARHIAQGFATCQPFQRQ